MQVQFLPRPFRQACPIPNTENRIPITICLPRGVSQRPDDLPWEQEDASSNLATPPYLVRVTGVGMAPAAGRHLPPSSMG